MPNKGQPPLGNYEPDAMYNCYEGHGGVELGYVGVTTPTSCAEECNSNDACKGFVYMYSQSKCWLRGDINLGECEVGEWGKENSEFTTFRKKLTCTQELQVCGGPGLPDSPCCDGMQCQRHLFGTSNLQCVRIQPQCVQAGQQCGCTGCMTQSCCGSHQCWEGSGTGGKMFCVNHAR